MGNGAAGAANIEEDSLQQAGRAAGAWAGRMVARPGLVARLDSGSRVMVVSAPAGSGKTVLLRSWITDADLSDRAAWVTAGRELRDPQRFWLSVAGALRQTAAGSGLVQPVAAAPGLDAWALAERLVTDLTPLRERLWLVVDDVHELEQEALQQLELVVTQAPAELRFVLASRGEVRLGLHRLRLEGQVAEIRGPDLRFSVAESGELLAAAGAVLPDPAVALLHERTEGWAAGLRLAGLALAGHPDPEGFAAGFSGSERTVADYLLAEVLDRQDERVRRLLLHTSVLERVNGELADLLTGDRGGERVLQDLEAAGAFVTSLDLSRSCFRYHQMFAELLRLELRRVTPREEVARLHRAASGWFAAHGYPLEAVRHTQRARDWGAAIRLLTEHWPALYLDGQATAIHELLADFPPQIWAADPELATLIAGDELAHGSLETAEQYLGLAERDMASVPAARQGQARLLLGIVRLLVARQRGNLPAEAQEAQRLEVMAASPDTARPALGEELRALTLISLGYANGWTAPPGQGRTGHLQQGISLARQTGLPYLEFTGLAYQAAIEAFWSLPAAAEHAGQAIELAERHGWTGMTAAGVACVALGGTLTWQGRLDEAEGWLRRAELTIKPEAEVVAALGVQYVHGQLQLARGRVADALAAFRAAERLTGQLPASHPFTRPVRACLLHTLVRVGETDLAEQTLAGLDGPERERGGIRIASAMLRLAQDDPYGALAALAPVLDGSVPLSWPPWLIQAFLLEAIAQEMGGNPAAAGRALERALDEAEPDGLLLPFLLHPVSGLVERHTRHHPGHAALIAEIQNMLSGTKSAPPAGSQLLEPLVDSELRVLRYLPTHLTAQEIATELFISRNTVKTHMRNLYAKLGTHRRAETVARSRALGLLGSSTRTAHLALADPRVRSH